MSCTRPDKNKALVSTWCNGDLKNQLPAFCNNIRAKHDMKGTDLNNPWEAYGRVEFKESNFVPDGWTQCGLDIKGNNQCCGSGSHGRCIIKDPLEHNKYACCAGTENKTVVCGPEWCPADSNCNNFWTNYCNQGDRLVDDANCFKKFKITKQTEIGQICTRADKFRTPNCKEFCDSQYSSAGPSLSYCKSAALQYCSKTPSDPACTCMNFNKGAAYASVQAKMPGAASLNNYQCWASACKTRGGPPWHTNLTTENIAGCQGVYQFCGQNLDVNNVKADTIGKIEQACTLNASTGTSVAPPTKAPVVTSAPAAPPPKAASPTPPALTPAPTPPKAPTTTPPAAAATPPAAAATPPAAAATPPAAAATPPKAATPPAATPAASTEIIKGVNNTSLYLGLFIMCIIIAFAAFMMMK